MTNNGPFQSRLQVGMAMVFALSCLCRLSTSDLQAQSGVLECVIGGGQRSETVRVDPTRNSIRAGNKVLEAEITPESITWK
jgi:hypothetical protein